MTITRTDAMTALTAAIEASGVATIDEYDTDAILDECYDEVGSWDIEQVEPDTFWGIVAENAN